MTNFPVNQMLLENQSPAEDEIDIRQIAGALIRRRTWIAGGSSLGVILAGMYLLTTKPVYQGEFQIVLSRENSQSGAASLLNEIPELAALADLGGAGTNDYIATEVQILNSPSVLRPVFDAVKASKPPGFSKRMRFQAWANKAITAKEEKGTSVLNVEFRDTDKNLVLPITQMISEAYQKYSNRGRTRELVNVINYLQTQIAIAKPKAAESSRLALDFGYANGLGLLDGLPLVGNALSSSETKLLAASGSVEATRTKAQQKILALEVQIREAIKASPDGLYMASQISSRLDDSDTFSKLTNVEARLAELRSRFTENDPLVQRLKRERTALVRYVNQQTIALLKGELDLAKATLQSLDRPKNVVTRHRELTQQALRDEGTLVTLQNQLRQYELEQARATSPWELISTPTLLEKPVSPRHIRDLVFGLLAGLVFGSAGALISDRRSGRVFSSEVLSRELPGPLLERLPCHRDERPNIAWHTQIQLLADGPLAGTGSVALIPVGSLDATDLDAFTAILRQALGEQRELLVSGDLLATRSCSTQLLLTAPGAAKHEQLRQLREQLALQGSPLTGWVLLDTSLKN